MKAATIMHEGTQSTEGNSERSTNFQHLFQRKRSCHIDAAKMSQACLKQSELQPNRAECGNSIDEWRL